MKNNPHQSTRYLEVMVDRHRFSTKPNLWIDIVYLCHLIRAGTLITTGRSATLKQEECGIPMSLVCQYFGPLLVCYSLHSLGAPLECPFEKLHWKYGPLMNVVHDYKGDHTSFAFLRNIVPRKSECQQWFDLNLSSIPAVSEAFAKLQPATGSWGKTTSTITFYTLMSPSQFKLYLYEQIRGKKQKWSVNCTHCNL